MQLRSNMSKVTIITPTWRRDPRIIRNCIGCVRYQTYNNWEHIICSDGEEEPIVRDLITQENDARRSYYHLTPDRNEQNDYGSGVRTAMMKKATGDYLCFYDDDNIIFPEYLRTLAEALDCNPDADFAICYIIHFGPVQSFIGKPPLVLTGLPPKLYHIDTLQVMVRATAISEWDTSHGGFYGDGTTFERLGQNYKYISVPQILGIHI